MSPDMSAIDDKRTQHFEQEAVEIWAAVAQACSAAAERPQDRHTFPVGRDLALSLGYPRELTHALPAFDGSKD